MVEGADLIVDTRNAIKVAAPNVFRLGAPAPGAHYCGAGGVGSADSPRKRVISRHIGSRLAIS